MKPAIATQGISFLIFFLFLHGCGDKTTITEESDQTADSDSETNSDTGTNSDTDTNSDTNTDSDTDTDTETEELYVSATMGAGGQDMGTALAAFQFFGSRFTLYESANVIAVGGHIMATIGDTSVFAAIAEMNGELPIGDPFTDDEVLATSVLYLSGDSDDVRVDLAVALEPGDYALIFGTGLFGSSGYGGAMPSEGQEDTPEGVGSYILWDNENGWYESVGFGYRFVVLE